MYGNRVVSLWRVKKPVRRRRQTGYLRKDGKTLHLKNCEATCVNKKTEKGNYNI